MAQKIELYIFAFYGGLTNTPFADKAPLTILPGRVEKLAPLQAEGAKTVTVHNAGGVAFGFETEEGAREEIAAIARELKLDGFRLAFGHPQPKRGYEKYAEKEYLDKRMPAPGMLVSLMKEHRVRACNTLMIGTRDEHRDAAHAAECNFMWAKDFFGNQAELLESVYQCFVARANALPEPSFYTLQFKANGGGELVWGTHGHVSLTEWSRLEEAPDLLQDAFDLERQKAEERKAAATVPATDDFDPFLDSDDLP